ALFRTAPSATSPSPSGVAVPTEEETQLQSELRLQTSLRIDVENRFLAETQRSQSLSRTLAQRTAQRDAAIEEERKARATIASLSERLAALRARNESLDRAGGVLEAKAARAEERARESSRLAVSLRSAESRVKELESALRAAQHRLTDMGTLEARLR